MQPPRRLQIALGLGGFAILAALFITQTYIWVNWWPFKIGWGEAVLLALPQLAIWMLLIPVALRMSQRFRIERGTRASRIVLHLVASVLLSLLSLYPLDLLDQSVHWTRFVSQSQIISSINYTIIHIHWGTAVYWVTLGVDHAVSYYTKFRDKELLSAQLEAQLAQAQLDALRMQLNPHFLFNTLNSIAVLMRRDVAAADNMLHRLSALLRVTLEQAGQQEVTLKEELEFLKSYVDIESVRFKDRLHVSFDVDPYALDASVPHLLLHPLVENAIRHGIAPKADGGSIRISAQRHDSRLALTVLDDGEGLGTKASTSTGVGLRNTRARLAKLYGDEHRFSIHATNGRGVEVHIEIPFTERSSGSSPPYGSSPAYDPESGP